MRLVVIPLISVMKMANNKVVFNNEVLIDLTQDTVTPDTLQKGFTAHAANGEQITGALSRIEFEIVSEYHTLTQAEVQTKSFALNYPVKEGKEDQVLLFLEGVALKNTDFSVSGNIISWQGNTRYQIKPVVNDVFLIQYSKEIIND